MFGGPRHCPICERITRVLVIAPPDLIAAKVQTMVGRRGHHKPMSDAGDCSAFC